MIHGQVILLQRQCDILAGGNGHNEKGCHIADQYTSNRGRTFIPNIFNGESGKI